MKFRLFQNTPMVKETEIASTPVVIDTKDPIVAPTQLTPLPEVKVTAFQPDVRLAWGVCNLASTAEILVTPNQSIGLGGSISDKKVFLEARHYFKPNHTNTFISTRVSTRQNWGLALGIRTETDYGVFSSKIGCYVPLKGPITTPIPAMGVSWDFMSE